MTAPAAYLRLVPGPDRPSRPCSVPGCNEPARLYPCGLRCDGHAPGPAITRVSASTLIAIPRHLEAAS